MTAATQTATVARTEQRRFPRPGRMALHTVIAVILFVWLLPTVGMLVNSLRPAVDVSASGWWTVFMNPNFTLDNYTHVLSQAGVGNAFLNSLLITIPSVVISVAVAGFAGYAFAWMNFRGRDVLFVVVVALLVVPLQTTLVPVLRLFNQTGIGKTALGPFLGVWIAHTGYGLPFAIYLLRNYMGGLPREVMESADIDGASTAVKFFRLVVPMSVPALAALTIFQFLFIWNDLLVALVYIGTQSANQPLTVLLANLGTSQGGDWQYTMAAAFISMALPLIVFFALQRYFVRGITGGAVKG
jgi:alpha-glucoside transport system permease protein